MRIFLLLFGKNHKEIIYYYPVFAISGEIRGVDIGSMPIVPKNYRRQGGKQPVLLLGMFCRVFNSER